MDSDPLPLERAALPLVESLLAGGHPVLVRVRGGSMSPWLPDGAVVTLRPIADGPPVAGDVVLARLADATPVMHRVVGNRRDAGGATSWLLKGDALAFADGFVPAEQVLGRVVACALPRGDGTTTSVALEGPLRRAWNRLLAACSLRCPGLFASASHRVGRRSGSRGAAR